MLTRIRPPVMPVVACAVLAVAGCRGNAATDAQQAKSTGLGSGGVSFASVSGPKPEGRFFAVMSPGGTNDDQLYELRFSPPQLRRLSPTRRVSAVAACQSRVVVTTGQEDAEASDSLQELQGDDFAPLEGLGLVAAVGPAVSPDCRVAYTFVEGSGPMTAAELRTWDPVRKRGKTLYRTRPAEGQLLGASWGPNGEVAVLRLPSEAPESPGGRQAGKGRPAAVVVVRPNGSSFEIDPGTLDPVGLVWGRSMMAIRDGEARTILLSPTDGKRVTVDSWRPLSWSPAGDTLLVNDAATGRILGLLDPDRASVEEIGRLTGPVFDADWLPG
jgi:hypothetical protein